MPTVSFEKMFNRMEATDEEAETRKATLRALRTLIGANPVPRQNPKTPLVEFTAAGVVKRLAQSANSFAFETNKTEDPDISDLRESCLPLRGRLAPTSRSVSNTLKAIVNAPVAVDDGVLTLRSSKYDNSNEAKCFWLEFHEKTTK